MPYYPRSHVDPPDLNKPKNVHTADCFKLVLKQPYHGSNYSVVFKRKTSLNTLYYVITKMELAKLNDSNITFNYYYSIKKGNKIIMAVEMNIKALHMVINTSNYSCTCSYICVYEFLCRFVKRGK